jgi:hypothetical protein
MSCFCGGSTFVSAGWKSCIGNTYLSEVEVLQVLLSELAIQVQTRIKCVEDEKSRLFKKLIVLCFNMEDQKADVLETQCNFHAMIAECQHLHEQKTKAKNCNLIFDQCLHLSNMLGKSKAKICSLNMQLGSNLQKETKSH